MSESECSVKELVGFIVSETNAITKAQQADNNVLPNFIYSLLHNLHMSFQKNWVKIRITRHYEKSRCKELYASVREWRVTVTCLDCEKETFIAANDAVDGEIITKQVMMITPKATQTWFLVLPDIQKIKVTHPKNVNIVKASGKKADFQKLCWRFYKDCLKMRLVNPDAAAPLLVQMMKDLKTPSD